MHFVFCRRGGVAEGGDEVADKRDFEEQRFHKGLGVGFHVTKCGRHIYLGFAGIDAGGGPVLNEAIGEETMRVLAEEDGLNMGWEGVEDE